MAKKRKKSKSKVPVLLVLGGISVAGYFWLSAQIKLISFGGISIPFQQLKDGKINLGLRLPILNASALAANITGFTGFIVSPSGATIGSVFLAEPATVQRYQQNELKFNAQIRITDLATEIGSLLIGGQLPTNWGSIMPYLKGYKLIGQLRVYGLPLPIEMPLI